MCHILNQRKSSGSQTNEPHTNWMLWIDSIPFIIWNFSVRKRNLFNLKRRCKKVQHFISINKAKKNTCKKGGLIIKAHSTNSLNIPNIVTVVHFSKINCGTFHLEYSSQHRNCTEKNVETNLKLIASKSCTASNNLNYFWSGDLFGIRPYKNIRSILNYNHHIAVAVDRPNGRWVHMRIDILICQLHRISLALQQSHDRCHHFDWNTKLWSPFQLSIQYCTVDTWCATFSVVLFRCVPIQFAVQHVAYIRFSGHHSRSNARLSVQQTCNLYHKISATGKHCRFLEVLIASKHQRHRPPVRHLDLSQSHLLWMQPMHLCLKMK